MSLSPPSYTIHPDDSGIVLSQDFAAAVMIREPGIRLVRLVHQPREADPWLKQVDRRFFFDTLCDNVRRKLVTGDDPVGLNFLENQAFQAVIAQNHRIVQALRPAGISLGVPFMRAAFKDRWCIQSPTFWHADFFNTVSFSLTGAGTDYQEGALSAPFMAEHVHNERLDYVPDHMKIRQTGPGDVLIMRGFGAVAPADGDMSRALFHRSCPVPGTRAVMLYGLR